MFLVFFLECILICILIYRWKDRFPAPPTATSSSPPPPNTEPPTDIDGFDYDIDEEEYIHDRVVGVKELVSSLLDQSRYFDNVNSLNERNKAFVEDVLLDIMHSRLDSTSSFEDFKRTSKQLLNSVLKNLDSDISSKAVELIKEFRKSEPLQRAYLKRKDTYVPSEPVIINDIEVGQYVSLKQLAKLALKNKSIVQSILDERKLPIQNKFDVYNSELSCSSERQNLLLGKLRIELGIDDFSVTKQNRKFFAVYGSFTNIPIEERLKRKDIFLIAMADRKVLKEGKISVNQFLRKLTEDLQSLAQDGVPIRVQFTGGVEKTITIKATLSSLVADNLGKST